MADSVVRVRVSLSQVAKSIGHDTAMRSMRKRHGSDPSLELVWTQEDWNAGVEAMERFARAAYRSLHGQEAPTIGHAYMSLQEAEASAQCTAILRRKRCPNPATQLFRSSGTGQRIYARCAKHPLAHGTLISGTEGSGNG